MQKMRSNSKKKLIFFILGLVIFSIFYATINTNLCAPKLNINHRPNVSLEQLATQPLINNITKNSNYFKNGDFITLRVNCDVANYTLNANFSTIDDQYQLNDESVKNVRGGVCAGRGLLS